MSLTVHLPEHLSQLAESLAAQRGASPESVIVELLEEVLETETRLSSTPAPTRRELLALARRRAKTLEVVPDEEIKARLRQVGDRILKQAIEKETAIEEDFLEDGE